MAGNVVTNVTIVISFMFVIDFFFRRGLGYEKGTVRQRIALGLMNGGLACALMLFAIPFEEHVNVDFRHIAIVLSAFYGGLWASVTTGVVAGAFRLAYFGAEGVGFVPAVFLLVAGVVSGLMTMPRLPRRPAVRFHLINAVVTAIASGALIYTASDTGMAARVLLLGWPASILGATAVYLATRRMDRAHLDTLRLRDREKELRRTAGLLQTMLEHVPGGLLVEDERGDIVFMNHEFLRLFDDDRSPAEYIGTSRGSFMEQYRHRWLEPESFLAKAAAWIEEETDVKDEYADLADGRIVQLDSVPIRKEGRERWRLWKFRDATAQKIHEKRLQEANTVLKRLSGFDGLTGIANRRGLDEHLAFEWEACRRAGKPFTVLLLDVDYFKRYNDTYGHLMGDSCLKIVAETLEKHLKRPDDFAARYGGEEFAVLLPDTTLADGFKVAERLRCAVERLAIPHERALSDGCVTVSVGVSCMVRAEDESPLQLMDRADRALYAAKQAGRNRVVALDGSGNQYVLD